MQLITSIKLNFDCNYDNQRPWGCSRKKTCIYCLFSYFCDTEGCSVRVSEGTPPSTCNHVLCLMTNMKLNVKEIQESICTTQCVREELLLLQDHRRWRYHRRRLDFQSSFISFRSSNTWGHQILWLIKVHTFIWNDP